MACVRGEVGLIRVAGRHAELSEEFAAKLAAQKDLLAENASKEAVRSLVSPFPRRAG